MVNSSVQTGAEDEAVLPDVVVTRHFSKTHEAINLFAVRNEIRNTFFSLTTNCEVDVSWFGSAYGSACQRERDDALHGLIHFDGRIPATFRCKK